MTAPAKWASAPGCRLSLGLGTLHPSAQRGGTEFRPRAPVASLAKPRVLWSAVIGLGCLWAASPVHAWGPQGHRIVGKVAKEHLCEAAGATIRELWGDSGLEAAGLWPDQIRNQSRWKHTGPWHYINVGDSGPLPPGERSPDGDILWALDHYLAILDAAGVPKRQRREAVGFVTHFVGDLHQPLHVGRADDRGGNNIAVAAPGRDTLNLHRYWDTTVITSVQPDPERYARMIAPLALGNLRYWQSTDPLAWASESLALRPTVYRFRNRGREVLLDEDYAQRAQTIVRMRLVQAGVRLAGILNARLAPAGTECIDPDGAEPGPLPRK